MYLLSVLFLCCVVNIELEYMTNVMHCNLKPPNIEQVVLPFNSLLPGLFS